MFLVILQYMLLASTFTLGKAAIDYAQPVFFVGVRMIIGGGLLLIYQYFFNHAHWKLERKDWFMLFKMMVFHIAISFGCEFWALQYAAAPKVAFLWNLSPFITALFAYHYYNDRMTFKKWIGLCIGFLGVLPEIVFSAPAELASGGWAFLSFAEMTVFVAVLSGSYAWIMMKDLVTNKSYSPIMVNGVAMFGGGIIDLLASFVVESSPYITLTPRFGAQCDTAFSQMLCSVFSYEYAGLVLLVLYLIALILIANVVCFNLYAYLLRSYSNTFLSLCGATTPLFSALFEWMFTGVMVGPIFFVSLGIVSLGLYIFYQEELNPSKSA